MKAHSIFAASLAASGVLFASAVGLMPSAYAQTVGAPQAVENFEFEDRPTRLRTEFPDNEYVFGYFGPTDDDYNSETLFRVEYGVNNDGSRANVPETFRFQLFAPTGPFFNRLVRGFRDELSAEPYDEVVVIRLIDGDPAAGELELCKLTSDGGDNASGQACADVPEHKNKNSFYHAYQSGHRSLSGGQILDPVFVNPDGSFGDPADETNSDSQLARCIAEFDTETCQNAPIARFISERVRCYKCVANSYAINRGSDNIFSKSGSRTRNNIGRVDLMITDPIVISQEQAQLFENENPGESLLDNVGFLLMERDGNDNFALAAITEITEIDPLINDSSADAGLRAFARLLRTYDALQFEVNSPDDPSDIFPDLIARGRSAKNLVTALGPLLNTAEVNNGSLSFSQIWGGTGRSFNTTVFMNSNPDPDNDPDAFIENRPDQDLGSQEINGSFISLADLGFSFGDLESNLDGTLLNDDGNVEFYGVSLFAADVTAAGGFDLITLTDIPRDTSGASGNVGGLDYMGGGGFFFREDTPIGELQIEKISSTRFFSDDTTGIDYSFVVTNSGAVPLQQLEITDAQLDGQQISITCPQTDLAVDESVTCQATDPYVPTNSDIANKLIRNTAEASACKSLNCAADERIRATDEVDVLYAGISLIKDAALLNGAVPTTDPLEFSAVGDIVTYTFTVTNNSNPNVPLDVTVIEDFFGGAGLPLPDPTFRQDLSPGIIDPTALQPGDSAVFSADYAIVQADLDNGSLIENQATASGSTEGSGFVVEDSDSEQIVADQQPGITIVKTADRDFYTAAREEITYSFVVTNTGNVTFTSVGVDELGFNGSGNLGTPVCPQGSLAPGDLVECAVSYLPTTADVANATTLINEAIAVGDYPCPELEVCTSTSPPDTAEVPFLPPAVTVTKTADPLAGTAVSLNDVIEYTLTVNVSNGPTLENVVLTDTLSSGLTFGSVTSAGSFIPNGTEFTLLSGAASGSYSITYTATVNNDAEGVVNNLVTVTGGVCQLPSDCTTSHPVDPAVTVVKTSDPASGTEVVLDQTITYTLTVNVLNNSTTAPVVLEDTLSAGLTFGEVTDPGIFAVNGTEFTLPASTTPGSYSVKYTATVNPDASGTVSNNVVATGEDEPECTACTTSHPVDPTVTVVKASSPASGAEVEPGDTITYTVTVAVANGPTTGDVVLTDTLDDQLTNVQVTNSGAFSDSGTVFTLPSGTGSGSYPITYTATVVDDAEGTVGNLVVPSGPDGPVCQEDGCTTSHPIDPAVTVVKTSDPASGSEVDPGQTITYTVTVTVANGPTTGDVVLTDTLDDQLTNVVVTDNGAFSDSGTVFTLPSGTGSGSYPITYTATVADDAEGTVSNVVVPSGPDDPVCEQSACTTSHPVDPTVTVTKTSDPASGTEVVPGATIIYTLTVDVANGPTTGPVVLDDTLSSGLTFGQETSLGAFTRSGTEFTLPAGTPTGSYDVVYTATVDEDAEVRVSNEVLPRGDDDPQCTTCATSHPITPDVTVLKSSDPVRGSAVAPGDTITYTVTVTVSNSPTTAAVVLDDQLDPQLTNFQVTNAGEFDVSGTTFTLPADTATGSYPITYTADVAADAEGSVGNQVTVTGGLCEVPADCTTSHPISPDVTVVKSSDPANGSAVAPGDTITYTVTVSVSNGPTNSAAVLDDQLDSQLTNFQVTNAGEFDVSGTTFTLPADTATGSYPITYTADVAADAEGSVGNQVVVTGGVCEGPADCTTDHPIPTLTVTATEICVNDVPYVDYTITVGESQTPVALSRAVRNGEVTINWIAVVDSSDAVIETLTTSELSDRLLWPGAEIDGADPANGIGWPGWEFTDGEWVEVPTNAKPQIGFEVELNGQTERVTVDYPPSTPFCSTGPRGEIRVIKNTSEPTDQAFTFTLANANAQAEVSASETIGSSASEVAVFDNLVPTSDGGTGSYSLTETEVDGWFLEDAFCDGGNTPSRIDLGPGEVVTCTFVNSRDPFQVTVSEECRFDIPYVVYDIEPFGSARVEGPVTIDWLLRGQEPPQETLTDQPLSGELVWFGTELDGQGNLISLPTPEQRDAMELRFTVDGETAPARRLSYPPAGASCSPSEAVPIPSLTSVSTTLLAILLLLFGLGSFRYRQMRS